MALSLLLLSPLLCRLQLSNTNGPVSVVVSLAVQDTANTNDPVSVTVSLAGQATAV